MEPDRVVLPGRGKSALAPGGMPKFPFVRNGEPNPTVRQGRIDGLCEENQPAKNCRCAYRELVSDFSKVKTGGTPQESHRFWFIQNALRELGANSRHTLM